MVPVDPTVITSFVHDHINADDNLGNYEDTIDIEDE